MRENVLQSYDIAHGARGQREEFDGKDGNRRIQRDMVLQRHPEAVGSEKVKEMLRARAVEPMKELHEH